MPADEEWRILAEEAAQEKDPKKLLRIISSLTAALDKQKHKKKTDPRDSVSPPS